VRTINTLNKVTRSVQDERRKAANSTAATGNPASGLPEFDISAFASYSGFPFHFEDNVQPFSFLRALENDVIDRNWRGGWWDVGTDLEIP
jgi:hypothetical protein